MNETELKQGFMELGNLSKAEYNSGLEQILQKQEKESAQRVGRLVGILLKEPFARAVSLPNASATTGAIRSWELQGADVFITQKETWQYRALDQIRQDFGFQNVREMAEEARREYGFFGIFAHELRKYLCDDSEVSQKVKELLSKANLPHITPDAILSAGGVAVATLLVQHIPLLEMASTAVVAGVVLILFKLGISAFCKWSQDVQTKE